MKKLLLISLLSLAGLAQAEEREWTTYKKFIEGMRLDRYYGLPAAERDKLDMYLTLKPANPQLKISDMNLTVISAGVRTVLPVDEKGHLRQAPNPQWMAGDAKIFTTQAKSEKISVSYNLVAMIPDGTQWSYNSLMDSVGQGNAAIGKVAGAFSLFAPNLKSVLLSFDKPSQLTIQSRSGTKQLISDAGNKIRLVPDKALQKENPLIVVSSRPNLADLDTD